MTYLQQQKKVNNAMFLVSCMKKSLSTLQQSSENETKIYFRESLPQTPLFELNFYLLNTLTQLQIHTPIHDNRLTSVYCLSRKTH